MLFPYKYVTHQMEKMQEFIDFIFHDVWCKASGNGLFRVELFDGNPDLKEVMTLFQIGDTQGGDFFYGHVDRIYGHFATLSPAQIFQFTLWYKANNDIEKACANDPVLQLARYTDITPINGDLCKELASFFKGLYSQEVLGIAALREKIGQIDDHYKCFIQENRVGKCPFCGISDMHGVYHSYREAYDHYLPKAFYPFISINFRNLAPACHHCNSTYKSTKDPTFTPKDTINLPVRRKAFYPYGNPGYSIEIHIILKRPDVDRLTPDDIELEYGPVALAEEINTWKAVYGIDERYKAKCCSETDGKYWLTQVMDEWQEGGRLPVDFMITLARQTQNNPFADSNFLKKAFLEGCQSIGILDAPPP